MSDKKLMVAKLVKVELTEKAEREFSFAVYNAHFAHLAAENKAGWGSLQAYIGEGVQAADKVAKNAATVLYGGLTPTPTGLFKLTIGEATVDEEGGFWSGFGVVGHRVV